MMVTEVALMKWIYINHDNKIMFPVLTCTLDNLEWIQLSQSTGIKV